MIEKRVGDDFDFVEANAAVAGVHADGRGVADEMNFMAAGRELHAQFGGDDAGAAVSGIARDADAHENLFVRLLCRHKPIREKHEALKGCATAARRQDAALPTGSG